MHRRILFAAVTACLAGAMTLAAASTASAAPKKFPSRDRTRRGRPGAGTGQSPDRRRRPGVERAVPVPGRAAGAVVRQQRLPAAILRRQPDRADPGDDRRALRRLHRQRPQPGAAGRPARRGRPDSADQHAGPEAAGRGDRHRPAAGTRTRSPTTSRSSRWPQPINGIRPISVVTVGTDALERPGTPAHGHRLGQHHRPAGRTRWRRQTHFPDRMQAGQGPGGQPRPSARTAYATADLPIDATMICAGRTNLDTCQGDSGGPMFVKAVGQPASCQVGITSSGHRLRRDRLPRRLHAPEQPVGGQLRAQPDRRRAGRRGGVTLGLPRGAGPAGGGPTDCPMWTDLRADGIRARAGGRRRPARPAAPRPAPRTGPGTRRPRPRSPR